MGLELDDETDTREALSSQPRPADAGHDGRRELVLRWLAEKLKTQKDARSCSIAWTLLRKTLRDTSVPSTTRVLGSTGLAAVIVDCLVEAFPATVLDEILKLGRSQSVAEGQDERPTEGKISKKSSKKRKRESLPVEPSGESDPSISGKSRKACFAEIANVLQIIVDRSKSTFGGIDAVSRSHMQALLKLDTAALASFQAHWLRALVCLLYTPDSSRSMSAGFLASCLSLMTSVGSLQPPSVTADKDTLSESFCKESLWPATLLLSLLRRETNFQDEARPKHEAIRTVERIIAEHVFLPARAQGSDLGYRRSNKSEDDSVDLEELTSTLKLELASLRSGAETSNAALQVYQHAQDAVPYLLDIALRCVNTSTPKRRIAERPWIDAVVATLTKVAGPPMQVSNGDTLGQSNQTVASLLDVVASRDLSLSTEALVQLVDKHCHLKETPRGDEPLELVSPPDFLVASKVLAMDAGVFVGSSNPATKKVDTDGKSYAYLGRSLLTTVSEHGLTSTYKNLLVEQILVPLMKAFARVRDLRFFLNSWLEYLKLTPECQAAEWFVWSDQQLSDALKEVLEASLTVTQVRDIIESIYRPLENLSDESTHLVADVYARSVLLNAVVSALHSDATIDELLPLLRTTAIRLEECLNHISKQQSLNATHSWEVLAKLRAILHSRLPDFAGIAAQQISSIELARSALAVNDISRQADCEADAAFVYIAQLCDLYRKRADAQDWILEQLLRACQSVEDQGTIPTADSMDSFGETSYASQRTNAFATTMIRYPHLLPYLPEALRLELFLSLYESAANAASTSSHDTVANLIEAVVESAVAAGVSSVPEDCFRAVLARYKAESLPSEDDMDTSVNNANVLLVAERVFLSWPLAAFTRQQREELIDHMTDVVTSQGAVSDAASLKRRLAVMVKLMEVPNATAKLAMDPTTLWQLVESLDKNTQIDEAVFCLVAELSRLTFMHIFDTKEQERSSKFITRQAELIEQFINGHKSYSSRSAALRLVSTSLVAAEKELPESALAQLAYRSAKTVKRFIKTLDSDVTSSLTSKDAAADPSTALAPLLDTISYLPATLRSLAGDKKIRLLDHEQGWKDIQAKAPQTTLAFKVGLACLQQPSGNLEYKDLTELCEVAAALLQLELATAEYYVVIDAFSSVLNRVSDADKITLINQCLEKGSEVYLILVHEAIKTLSQVKDQADDNSSLILPSLLRLLRSSTAYAIHRRASDCVLTILRSKLFLVNQFSVEMTLSTIGLLASPSSPALPSKRATTIYATLCNILQTIFLLHRSSLGGRFHLVVPVLQRLMAMLFIPHTKGTSKTDHFLHPSWLDTRTQPLTAKHAAKFGRLLTVFCNPPPSAITRHRTAAKTPDLVDEVRKARMHIGTYVQYVLHTFCALVLNGRLGEGMRDALTPGLWAMLDVMEMGGDEKRGVKALSAGMGHAERAVLRGVWDDWKRFGAWKG